MRTAARLANAPQLRDRVRQVACAGPTDATRTRAWVSVTSGQVRKWRAMQRKWSSRVVSQNAHRARSSVARLKNARMDHTTTRTAASFAAAASRQKFAPPSACRGLTAAIRAGARLTARLGLAQSWPAHGRGARNVSRVTTLTFPADGMHRPRVALSTRQSTCHRRCKRWHLYQTQRVRRKQPKPRKTIGANTMCPLARTAMWASGDRLSQPSAQSRAAWVSDCGTATSQ